MKAATPRRPADFSTCAIDTDSEPASRRIIVEPDHEEEPEECEDDTPRRRTDVPEMARSMSSSSSHYSADSEHTNNSMDSLPEPVGGERPLTIPKKRDIRASQNSQIQGDALYGMLLNDCRDDTSEEKGVTDIMASLGQMSLSETVPDNRRGTFGEVDGLPPTALQSLHSTTSHIPRLNHGLSSRPSLMFLDRRSNGSGSESTSSCYSDMVNTARTGFSKILQRSSPTPSFRSVQGVPTSGFGAHPAVQNLRNSPWLRTAKSMHHMSAAVASSRGPYGEMSISPPVPVMDNEFNPDAMGGGDGSDVRGRDYSTPNSRKSSIDDPYVLVPRIVVTPESKTLEDGATGLWAAVQISTEIRPANASVSQQDGSLHIRGPSQLDVFRYGCLYDVSVEVLATESSVIVEVLKDKPYETISTLYPGSRLLIIAHVGIIDQSPPHAKFHGLRHARQSSDDLIQDLEHHLGNKLIEYLQIRIKYHHTSFPNQKYDQTTEPDGTVEVQTLIETTARAAIKQHNSSSFWSPRPIIQANPLFEIVASHWGPGRAGEVMQRIVNSHSTAHHTKERKPTPVTKRLPMIPSGLDPRDYHGTDIHTTEEGSDETLKQKVVPAPTRMPPPIPQRHASLGRLPPKAISNEKNQTQRTQAIDVTPKNQKVWTQMRRTSGADFSSPESTSTQRSFMKSSVSRVPSAEMPASPLSNSVELSRSNSTNATGKTGTASGAAYSLRGSRLLNSRVPERQAQTDLRLHSVDGRIRTHGEYPVSNMGSHGTDGPSTTMDWAGTGGDGTRTSKRVGNEMVDEERARRRQKMMILGEPQPATISVAGGRGSNRGSMGSPYRGSVGGGYRQSPSSTDLYRAAEEEFSLGAGQGRRGFDHQRSDGGGGGYSFGGSKTKKGDKSATATGRWGWAGWWP